MLIRTLYLSLYLFASSVFIAELPPPINAQGSSVVLRIQREQQRRNARIREDAARRRTEYERWRRQWQEWERRHQQQLRTLRRVPNK